MQAVQRSEITTPAAVRQILTDPGYVVPDPGRDAGSAPVNVLFAPGRHTLPRLAALGVARVSLGSLPFRAAVGAATQLAEKIRSGQPVSDSGAPGYTGVPSATRRRYTPVKNICELTARTGKLAAGGSRDSERNASEQAGRQAAARPA
jgi:hypothetical protein